MKIKLAIATNNEKELTLEHFGSAKKYLIYSLDLKNKQIQLLKKIKNLTPAEKKHGDPQKAKAIFQTLNNVQVLVNLAFGPNITKMRKKFVPIVSRIKKINKNLEEIKLISNKIKKELHKKEKDIIYL